MQYAAAQVVDPERDQGHYRQHGGDQQTSAQTHAVKHHGNNNQHTDQQTAFQIMQPRGHLIRLKKHFFDLQWCKLRRQFSQALSQCSTEINRVDLPTAGIQAEQYHPLTVVPGLRLGRFQWPAPDISNRRQRHKTAIR